MKYNPREGLGFQDELLPFLALHPEELVESRSCEQASHWIRQLGLNKNFPPPAEQKSYILGDKTSPTHWIIAGIVYPPFTDSGEAQFVLCYPRKHFTEEQVVKRVMDDWKGRKMDHRKAKSWEP